MEKRLLEIYKQRRKDCIRFLEEGKSFEEMLEAVQHYQDEIEEFLPFKKKLKKIGPHTIFRLLGLGRPTINRKVKYARILLKRVGYEYWDEDGVFNAVLDNADEEDIKWYMEIIEKKMK